MENNGSCNTDIIFIGPICSGKSTLATLVAEQLHLPCIALDDLFWAYNEQLGYGRLAFKKVLQEQGFQGAFPLMQQLCASAVKQVLSEYHHCVFDFGAGHTHYEDEYLLAKVRSMLKPYQHIILVLPSPDLDQSVRILKERCQNERGENWIVDGYDLIEHWVKDRSNHELATHTVYTQGKTPAEMCAEILVDIVC